MSDPVVTFRALADYLRARYPGFAIRFKDESRLMRALAALLFFVRGFLTGFTTTLHTIVYFPTRAEVEGPKPPWATLAHEAVHIFDSVAGRVSFVLLYTFPQNLALLSLGAFGAFWSPWFLLSLIALAALAPWPSPTRTRLERRGYLMTMVCDAISRGAAYVRQPAYQTWMASHFTGWAYYRMTWRRSVAADFVADDAELAVEIANGSTRLEPWSSLADVIWADRVAAQRERWARGQA